MYSIRSEIITIWNESHNLQASWRQSLPDIFNDIYDKIDSDVIREMGNSKLSTERPTNHRFPSKACYFSYSKWAEIVQLPKSNPAITESSIWVQLDYLLIWPSCQQLRGWKVLMNSSIMFLEVLKIDISINTICCNNRFCSYYHQWICHLKHGESVCCAGYTVVSLAC